MDPRGVFFDLYGTLLIFGDLRRAWDGWFDVLHRHLGAMGLDATRSDLARQCDGFFARPEPSGHDDGLTIFERRFQDFCLELGLAPEPRALHELADAAVRAWQEHVHPDPEAESVLAALGARHRLALITNFDHPRHVHGLLADWGIRDYFDTVVVSGDVGLSKPHPRIFEIALEETGLLAEEAIHVGDSVEDVNGARQAGLVPVLIQRPRPGGEPILLDYSIGRGTEAPAPSFGQVVTVPSLGALLELLD
ncbi:MAG: HAD family hydrolase [Gemmatimonadota bacterium]